MKQENVEDNRKNSMEKTDVINRSSPDKNGVNESESPHKHEVTSNEMVNPSQVPEDKKQSDAVASFPSKTSKTQSKDPPTIIVPVDSPDVSQQINTQGRPIIQLQLLLGVGKIFDYLCNRTFFLPLVQ